MTYSSIFVGRDRQENVVDVPFSRIMFRTVDVFPSTFLDPGTINSNPSTNMTRTLDELET